MIQLLKKSNQKIADFFVSLARKLVVTGDGKALAIKIALALIATGLGIIFFQDWSSYREWVGNPKFGLEPAPGDAAQTSPGGVPLIGKAFGFGLTSLAFLISLFIRDVPGKERLREQLIVTVFWIAALGSLAAWLPADVISTKAALSGKLLEGENPSIITYVGKLIMITFLMVSVPIISMFYFRLGIMDQYVVRSFLSPFCFCLFGFIAIWVIANITDKGAELVSLTPQEVAAFYLHQVPFIILFVMPIVMLLAGLSSLSTLSKSNEFISMIGSGRSVLRILSPLLFLGFYASLICFALKYEWAPNSTEYKEAVLALAGDRRAQAQNPDQQSQTEQQELWSRRGWMYINEVDRRTWFVGKVPLRHSDPMAEILIWQMDEAGNLEKAWKAERGRWIWDANPPEWIFQNLTVYEYGNRKYPLKKKHEDFGISGWRETPWMVLSSSRDPEFLGLPGLTMYLNAHSDSDSVNLAPYRTNRQYIFSEPVGCFVMLLVSAPLGIVYSRRGVMGGVTGAIIIFAMMYVMRGTLLAMGQSHRIDPVMGAWGTNLIITLIGVILLWFRARNREVPKLRNLFRRKPSPA